MRRPRPSVLPFIFPRTAAYVKKIYPRRVVIIIIIDIIIYYCVTYVRAGRTATPVRSHSRHILRRLLPQTLSVADAIVVLVNMFFVCALRLSAPRLSTCCCVSIPCPNYISKLFDFENFIVFDEIANGRCSPRIVGYDCTQAIQVKNSTHVLNALYECN